MKLTQNIFLVLMQYGCFPPQWWYQRYEACLDCLLWWCLFDGLLICVCYLYEVQNVEVVGFAL